MDIKGAKAFINFLHYPVYTLGPGKRIGLWFQGCTIHCKDCIAKHTWEFSEEYLVELDFLLKKILSYREKRITISGGEPFDQAESLYMILKYLRNNNFFDILVYSGYRYEYLIKKYSHILSFIDILIDGNFISGMETPFIWKGSDNQRMFILSENLEIIRLYSSYRNRKKDKKLQIVKGEDSVMIIGIPYQNDVEKIKNWR